MVKRFAGQFAWTSKLNYKYILIIHRSMIPHYLTAPRGGDTKQRHPHDSKSQLKQIKQLSLPRQNDGQKRNNTKHYNVKQGANTKTHKNGSSNKRWINDRIADRMDSSRGHRRLKTFFAASIS